MKTERPLFKLIILGFLTVMSVQASAQFRLGAEVRPRAEYRHGFKKLIEGKEQDPAFFVEQRTRLTANYNSEKTEFMLSLQDVRIWGAENQIYKPGVSTANYFTAVNQAWGKYKFNHSWAIKLGRQELDYDNARMLGNLAWAQQSRSHDAALVTWQDSVSSFHLGAVFNQDGTTPEYAKLVGTYYGVSGNYKTLQFAWYHRNWERSQLSFLFMNNGLQAVDSTTGGVTRFSQTAGFIGDHRLGQFKLTGEFYYQFGKDRVGNKLSAYLVSLAVESPLAKNFKASLGFDYLSGTAVDEAAGENHSFTPFYGTNHKFYGFMDYFYVGNPSAQNGKTIGLINPYIKFTYSLPGKSVLMAHVHQFFSPVDIYRNPGELTGETGRGLGTEIDLVFGTSIAPGVNLNLGYSQLFATESMQVIKGGNEKSLQNWAWLMVTFKPTLFESK